MSNILISIYTEELQECKTKQNVSSCIDCNSCLFYKRKLFLQNLIQKQTDKELKYCIKCNKQTNLNSYLLCKDCDSIV